MIVSAQNRRPPRRGIRSVRIELGVDAALASSATAVTLLCARSLGNGFGNETRAQRPRWRGMRRDGLDGREVVTCRSATREATGDGDRLAHNPEVADPYLVLASSGNASGGLRPWRLSCRSWTRIDLSALGATSWRSSANDGLHVWLPEALGPLMRASFVSDSQKPTTAESCPVHVLCSNDSYASKQVKRSPFSAWKCLRRRSAAFTVASHAEGHWFDPSRDHD